MTTGRSKITIHNTPFLLLLASLAIGIVAGSLYPCWWLCCVWLLPALIIYLYRRSVLRSPIDIVASSLLARWQYSLIIAALGIATAYIHHPGNPDRDYDSYSHMQGEVLESYSSTSGTGYLLRIQSVSNNGNDSYREITPFDIRLYNNDMELHRGDIIRLPMDIREIGDNPNYAEPRQTSIFPSTTPQYTTSATRYDINIIGNRNESIRYFPDKIRDAILIKIDLSSLDKNSKQLLSIMLMADKQAVPSEMRQQFADAGIAHILAVSGLHVGIVASIILLILWPLRITRYRNCLYPVAILFIWLYTLICGAPASAVRASLMLTLCMLAFMYEREYNALNALCAAAFIILVFSPFEMFNTSLQFSFLAVYALIVLVPAMVPVSRKKRTIYKLLSLLVSTIIVSIACWGVMSFWYGRIPLLFIPANMLILPLLPIYMGCAIFYVSMLFVGIDIRWFAIAIDWGSSRITAIAEWVASNNLSAIDFRSGLLGALLYFAALMCAGIWVFYRRRAYIYAAAVLCIGAVMSVLMAPETPQASGYIVTDNHRCVEIRKYDKGDRVEVYPMQESVCEMDMHGHRIITVTQKIAETDTIINCDVLIVGNGFKGNANRLLDHFDTNIVVIASGLDRYRTKNIHDACSTRGLPCHEIAINGPYRVLK